MKSKITKIQKILMKGMAVFLAGMMVASPLIYATTSLDDSYLDSSWWEKLLYGTVGSTAKEIEEYFNSGKTTLYISNETQLRAFAEYVNNGNDCSGKEIYLLNDIEVDSSVEWDPIGRDKDNTFNGTFDGQGYTISGVTYLKEAKNFDELKNIGLFGIVEEGIIRNLITKNFNINILYSVGNQGNSYGNTGNIAGAIYSGTLENCINYSDIFGCSNVGGIVGTAWTEDTNIINCINSGKVNGLKMIGGICGLIYPSNTNKFVKIQNCSNEGNIEKIVGESSVEETAGGSGGICGYSGGNTLIQDCYNKGEIVGTQMTGGITGFITGEINHCINDGSVIGTNSYVGGITGVLSTNSKIYNTINKGDVKGTNYVGGIVGYSNGSDNRNSIEYNLNKSVIRGKDYVGGIVGAATNTNINYCYNVEAQESYFLDDINSQEILAISGIGGIAGYAENTNIKYCVNTAEICGVTRDIGGIVGYMDNTVIQHCAALQNVFVDTIGWSYKEGGDFYRNASYYNPNNEVVQSISGEPSNIGGIAGMIENNTNASNEISNCYVSGLSEGILGINHVGGIVGTNACRYSNNIKNNKRDEQFTRLTCFCDYEVHWVYESIHINTLEIGTNTGIICGCGSSSDGEYYCLNDINSKGLEVLSYGNKEYSGIDLEAYGANASYAYDVSDAKNLTSDKTYLNMSINGKDILLGTDLNESGVGNVLESTEETKDFGEAKVTFKVESGKILKAGDVIKVTASFDRYLAKSVVPLVAITDMPILKINNSIEMEKDDISTNTSEYTTTIYYRYTIKDGDNFEIKSLDLYKNGTIYAVDGKDSYSIINVDSVSTKISGVVVDTFNPTLSSETYVENELETARYTSGKEVIIKVATSERIEGTSDVPEVQVSFSKSGIGKYNYEENGKVGYAKCINGIINLDGTTTWVYSYQIQEGDEGILQINYASGKITDLAGNETDLTTLQKEEKKLYADTTLPTVEIIAKDVKNSITNKDKIVYEFKWSEELAKASEEIEGFTLEDITVNNGEKGTLSEVTKNEDGTYSYTMEITTSIEDGSIGDLQVIIEQDACKDLVGQGNVRTESVIRVDKRAPILQSLEAYAFSNSNININPDIDVVKEYYKEDDIIIIVATFDENISGDTNLALNFSESGNVKENIKGVISEENKNQIIYTYKIKDGNKGTLSVRAITGTVKDAVGNETMVTKKALDGNTIIADTIDPILNELKVTSTRIANNADKEITIEAVYSEEIFALITKEDGTKEIVNITKDNAPDLKLTFGGIPAKREEMHSVKYGETDGKEDKTKIVYTYKVKGQETEGDNGVLDFIQKENIPVCDIAGNTSSNNVPNTKDTNGVYADTKRPLVENITANVEGIIENTGIYHKAGNEIKIAVKFSEDVHAAKLWSRILVGFSEEEGVEPSNYKQVLDLNATTDLREYTYTIEEGDNGFLWVKVEEGHYADEAGNGNVAEELTEEGTLRGVELKTVYADTIDPHINVHTDTEIKQDGQTITVLAKFNENVYDLDGQTLKELDEKYAPVLLYGFEGATEVLTAPAKDVTNNVITYEITKNNTISGEFYCAYLKGNLYDRAGNEFFTNGLDTIAPVLEKVEISSNTNYEYCKEGTEIYVTATFNEQISDKNINMNLEAKIENSQTTEIIKGEVSEVNPKQVVFTYIVKAGDTGEFVIIDVCGETNSQITEEDNDYGYVQDLFGNQNNIYSFENEGVEVEGKEIADTTAPYITNIKAISNDKEIATYTKKDGEDVVVTVGRTNANIVEYIVTYNEEVPYKHLEDLEKITITNGRITERKAIDKYSYKITVQTTVEGVQSLIINEGIVEDKAGNIDGFVRLDAVTVDFTKPTVRFISEYNGGVYVLPTNVEKIELRPNVEISEEIDKIEYKWAKLEDGAWKDIKAYAEVDNYTSLSDITIDTQTFGEGDYKLFIKVVDLAGNIYETKDGVKYKVVKSEITLSPDTYMDTNQDVIVEITFGEGLTDNRKVIFKPQDETKSKELSKNEEGKYVVDTYLNGNGTIYVEATDRVGNKVYNELSITNIDTEDPVVEFELYGADLIIGTGKEKATIKTGVEVTDNMTILPDAKYVFLQEDHDVYNMTEEQKTALKSKITNELGIEAIKEDAVSTKGSTPYYLYILAADNAGNETITKSGAFTVVDTNPSGEENTVPAEIEINKLISFEQKGKNIYISYNNFSEAEEYLNIIREKEVSLTNERDGYADFEGYYVEVNGATTITVIGTDACGNQVIATHEVTKDSIEGPEFDVIGNPKDWTNQDVKLEVSCYEALSALTVNGTDILSKEEGVRSNTVITQNGDYEFIAIDTYGNISKKTITVSKIDKELPVISKVENVGKAITITAIDELSGIKEYAISTTTEVPVEWSKSNVIKVTEDGTFYVWAKDAAGNVSRAENTIVVDTTAPIITFSYLSQTITVGMPIEANIVTNEDAIISYSWDKQTWVDSTELISSIKVSEKSTTTGKYTLYAKASDKAGNESKVETLEFNVVNVEEIRQPDIVFEDISTIQVNGVKYVKVSPNTSIEYLTNRMNQDALCGKTPEFIKLTEDGKLKTGSEITINGSTKYIVVVKGDVNSDGKVTFDDIIKTNAVRISAAEDSITKAQLLAVDINNTAKIEFKDIISINAIRINSTNLS